MAQRKSVKQIVHLGEAFGVVMRRRLSRHRRINLGIGVPGFALAPCNVSQQEIVKKELGLFGSRLNNRFLPQVVQWLARSRLRPAARIAQVFAAADARAAFDVIERNPASTTKVHLDFAQ